MIGGLTFSQRAALPELRMALSAGTAPATPGPESSFGSVLTQLVSSAREDLRAGEAAALAGIEGSMPIQTVVDRVMAAERTLQTALAVRDKFVSAYLEISRMQI
jgi:flagellar hook-basal body complex protein FliE